MDEKTLNDLVSKIVANIQKNNNVLPNDEPENGYNIPLGVSNKHIHLTQEHVEVLFGAGYQLTHLKDLTQPGQFACKETLTLVGPSMKAIEGVRILGPVRKASQVEISRTDARLLKLNPPIRESGDVKNSASITLIGPKSTLVLKEGCILANRHIHMSINDSIRFNVKDGDYVAVETKGDGKRTTLWDCQVRVSDKFVLEMHLDTDDANACGLSNESKVKLIK